ncbi:hypothetical protein [Streptomyces gardneri]|uniref:Uncharacterized protein n=1 Tax=Streptomyces gardneri TaxID=66892 RepID=A0A4Y3RVI5_9ACTN|nr:hypothetical protein [Streptomyces gardneri]GEB60847.1 hypothetical protein SGA01_64520 [Streptomyces gardneri]GHG81500.1 hypothetical protein GCM10017674_02240 [Streptomyces gardneri]
MARVEEGMPYGWGRLYAAFHVLEGLARGRTELGLPAKLKETVGRPRTTFESLLGKAGIQVLAAREKGGDRARAVETVFADVAKLIRPEPMIRRGLSQAEAEEFRQGYEHQLGLYRAEWEALVV